MGIISWIKSKYIDKKFQRAEQLRSEGDAETAINILKDILESHPDAPKKLLDIYHSLISQNQTRYVVEVAELYSEHKELKDACLYFARWFYSVNQGRLYMDYCQALYGKGVLSLKESFVKTATQYVCANQINSLKILSTNTDLLASLSKSLLIEARIFYKGNKLSRCYDLCLLVKPYISSSEFFELFVSVRFDIIAGDIITEETVSNLDKLIADVTKCYNLRKTFVDSLFVKGEQLSVRLFGMEAYGQALLVSQRFQNAKEIYVKSALELYRSASEHISAIDVGYLYKCLGDDSSVLVNALEPFIPYSSYRQKYISVVDDELLRLVHLLDNKPAESLFNKAWKLAPDESFLRIILSKGNENEKKHFTSFILNSSFNILENNVYLRIFVTELLKFEDAEFITEVLELLLDKKKDVVSEYETQIIKFAGEKRFLRNRIETIGRGLAKVQTPRLYSSAANYLNDYIENGLFDYDFAFSTANSLIGHSGLAEVLIAKLLIYESKHSDGVTSKEDSLRKALEIEKKHNCLFDENAYKVVKSQIGCLITKLASDLYVDNPSHSIELFYLLRDNGLDWFDKYASLFLASIQKAQNSKAIALRILGVINEGTGIASQLTDKLWSKYVFVELSVVGNYGVCDAVSELKNLLSYLQVNCRSENKGELEIQISSALGKLLLSRAMDYERKEMYKEAIDDYHMLISICGDDFDIETRICICNFKIGKKFSQDDKELINTCLSSSGKQSYKKDLAYRWCLYLISNDEYDEANQINTRILGDDCDIKQLYVNKKIIEKQKILDDLNERIEKLNNSTLVPEDAVALGQSLSQTLHDLKFIVEVSAQQENQLKEIIRLYAIEKFYEKGDYIQCINGLKVQDSTYLSDPIALHNIAIMCLNAAETGKMTEDNYMELLAIWATAIYQQKLFVDSLDYTSWDDPYTFSLNSALGKLYHEDHKDLPDNVGYSDSSGNGVVSILDVQKSLIARMEVAIKDNLKYQQFFSLQLEVMDKLAEQNLDIECVLVAPYLTKLSKSYWQDVRNALVEEAKQHYDNFEQILEIGCFYNITIGAFKRYKTASSCLEMITNRLKCGLSINDYSTLSTLETNMAMIRSFDGLKSKLVSVVTTSMNKDITNDIGYSEFMFTYENVVKIMGEDNVSFVFSNYINQKIVKVLNEKTLPITKGAHVLFRIYKYCKCNPHLKRNVENLVETLIHNYISDGEEANLPILESVLTNTREFDFQVTKALTGGGSVPEEMILLLFSSNMNHFETLRMKIGNLSSVISNQFAITSQKLSALNLQLELSKIVDQVNNNTIQKCDALQKVYNLYRKNGDDNRVCQNLATLIPMCVMEYVVADKYGRTKVENILDSLKINMSQTFRRNSFEIRKSYNLLWSKLPSDARVAIQIDSPMLNEQGRALKKGLDYLKTLG